MDRTATHGGIEKGFAVGGSSCPLHAALFASDGHDKTNRQKDTLTMLVQAFGDFRSYLPFEHWD